MDGSIGLHWRNHGGSIVRRDLCKLPHRWRYVADFGGVELRVHERTRRIPIAITATAWHRGLERGLHSIFSGNKPGIHREGVTNRDGLVLDLP